MMGVVKKALLLLLLGVVVSNAEPENCEPLTKRQLATDLDKIVGHWVSIWGVADRAEGDQVLDSVSTLHVEWSVRSDSRVVQFKEKNLFKHDHSICINVEINSTIASDTELLTLHSTSTEMDVNGAPRPYNETYEIHFYQTCPDCLVSVFNTVEHGRFLMNYRKEGQHQDIAGQKAFEDQMKKQAQCLQFPTERPYVYDGVTAFCH
ncbi:unnamed protein product [Ophioblennius macclurei]